MTLDLLDFLHYYSSTTYAGSSIALPCTMLHYFHSKNLFKNSTIRLAEYLVILTEPCSIGSYKYIIIAKRLIDTIVVWKRCCYINGLSFLREKYWQYCCSSDKSLTNRKINRHQNFYFQRFTFLTGNFMYIASSKYLFHWFNRNRIWLPIFPNQLSLVRFKKFNWGKNLVVSESHKYIPWIRWVHQYIFH